MKEGAYVKFWKNGNEICFSCSNGYAGSEPIKNGKTVQTFNKTLSHIEKVLKIREF